MAADTNNGEPARVCCETATGDKRKRLKDEEITQVYGKKKIDGGVVARVREGTKKAFGN